MAQIRCNFYSHSIGNPVEIQLVIPSVSSCDKGDALSHKLPAKFPILYLLHGHGNDYSCWLRYTSAERYAEEHRIAIVTMSVMNSAYENQEGIGPMYYDFISNELPEFLTSYFPISNRPEDTFIAGYSMGGYGAAIHGFLEPEKYSAIGLFSPAVGSPKSATGRSPIAKKHAPMDMLDDISKNNYTLPKLFLCIGHEDFLFEPVEAFHQKLEALNNEHRYDSLPGYEHEFAFWDKELEAFLNWIPRSDFYADKIPHKI